MDTVTVELDAYEIANKVFSDSGELDNNFTFENVDLKTLFEMLLIIFSERFFHNTVIPTYHLFHTQLKAIVCCSATT